MKFVFFGTDDFSIIVLDELKRAGLMPSLIVTTSDKPRGRGLKVFSSPAKLWAGENNIPVAELTPDVGDFKHRVSASTVELFVVASYGKIIPKTILDISEYGALNVHPSLLPKYRGPSPIESQILNDEKEIGVTIMQMDEQMDHGPIVAQKRVNQTSGAKALRKTLAEMGGKLLAEIIPKWVSGEITAVSQDESKATYTRKFTKADGEINIADDPYKNFLKVRAFDGTIGTYFFSGETRIKIIEADFRDKKLEILRVIPEGKKERSYKVGFSAGSGAMRRPPDDEVDARQIL